MQEGYEDPFVAPPILTNLVGQSKTFQVSFGNQNINFGKTDFIVHGLLEDKPLSKPANPSIKPQTPAPTAAKTIINQVTPAPLTPSQPLDNNPDQLQPLRLQKQRCSLINQTHLPAYVISFFRWFSIGFHSKTQKLRVKTLKLKGMRHLHASQSADVRALTTCSSLILKQSNPLLSPSPSPYAFALSHNLYVVRNYLSSRDLRFSVSKQ